MNTLTELGVSIKEITDSLTDDGVRQFVQAFDKLLQAVEKTTQRGVTPG